MLYRRLPSAVAHPVKHHNSIHHALSKKESGALYSLEAHSVQWDD